MLVVPELVKPPAPNMLNVPALMLSVPLLMSVIAPLLPLKVVVPVLVLVMVAPTWLLNVIAPPLQQVSHNWLFKILNCPPDRLLNVRVPLGVRCCCVPFQFTVPLLLKVVGAKKGVDAFGAVVLLML